MRKLISVVKKAYWSVFAAIVCILATVLHVLQMIRTFLLLILQLPETILHYLFLLGELFLCVGIFTSSFETGTKIATAIVSCLLMFFLYGALRWLYSFLSEILSAVLDSLDPENSIEWFAFLFRQAIYRYLDSKSPTKFDRAFFVIPFFLLKSHWLIEKLSLVVTYLLYPVSLFAGLLFSYRWAFSYDNTGIALFSAWLIVLISGAFSLYVGHIISRTIRSLPEFSYPLFDTIREYLRFFQQSEPGENNNSNHHKGSSHTNGQSDASYAHAPINSHPEETPYFDQLGSAQSPSELKTLYHKLCMELHPDICQTLSTAEANRHMSMLNEAYEYYKQHQHW